MKRSFHHLNKVIREKFLERKTASKLKSTAIGLAGIILSACGRNIDPDETGTSLLPTAFDDVLRGSSAVDSITALAGNDTIYGFGGNDQILAGDGNDTIYGGEGDDYIDPGAGDDTIYGGRK